MLSIRTVTVATVTNTRSTAPTTTISTVRMARVMEQARSRSTRCPPRFLESIVIHNAVWTTNTCLQGTDAKSAYQLIHDELTLDGSPNLNLASFVHTWMPPEAEKLIMENIAKVRSCYQRVIPNEPSPRMPLIKTSTPLYVLCCSFYARSQKKTS